MLDRIFGAGDRRVVEFRPSLFVYFHEYIWQGAFLMLVTLYAMTWVEWVRR